MSRRPNIWRLENHRANSSIYKDLYNTVKAMGLYCSIVRNGRMCIGGWATMEKPHVFVEVHEYTTELAIMKDCRDYYYMVRDKYPSLLDELMNKKREERIS